MLLYVPVSTDAPVYHWPFATVGLIVVNTLLFIFVPTELVNPEGPWLLAFGQGMRPDQWFGSSFMHGSGMHLIGNMIFLWVFGLVVEGKLGWWRFLACYLLIALCESALIQAVMLGYTGQVPGALGASAAIYGILAMAAVWAPANNVTFYYLIAIYGGLFDMQLGLVAAIYIGLDILFALLFGMGSSLLHITGAAFGFPLAVLLLKRGVVDCEGWDMFSRLGYAKGPDKPRRAAAHAEKENGAARQDAAQRIAGAGEAVDTFLGAGNPAAVLRLCEKLDPERGALLLDTPRLTALVRGLHAEKQWAPSAPLMAELIDRAPDRSDPLRLTLAQICLVELGRPGRALELLSHADPARLSDKQNALAQKVVRRAERMQDEGAVELDDGAW